MDEHILDRPDYSMICSKYRSIKDMIINIVQANVQQFINGYYHSISWYVVFIIKCIDASIQRITL